MIDMYMGNHVGQRKVHLIQHFFFFLNSLKNERQTLELNTKGQCKGKLGKDAYFPISCIQFFDVNFQLNSKCNTCSANQPPHKTFKS